MNSEFRAGAAAVDITPEDSVHLYGYPHVRRMSTGVHDPLFASALYLFDGKEALVFVSCDVIFVPKGLATDARRRIEGATGVESSKILVAATHTHSGPGTVAYLSNEEDSTVPPPSPEFLVRLEDGIVASAERAVATARRAEVGMALVDGSCVGTNRRDPRGPRDPRVPVVIARDGATGEAMGLMLICAMHPTVLHEDSTVISGDFPAFTRAYLQREVLGAECPVVYFMGASGNQSPRHVVHANTLAEAKRLGEDLGGRVVEAMSKATFDHRIILWSSRVDVELPLRTFPSVEDAESKLRAARTRFEALQKTGAPRTECRTAECDLFGAEESMTLARAARSGRVAKFAESSQPAEALVLGIGPWCFVGWPGEVFVEFALELRAQFPDAYVITLANGELQGYLVTEDAVTEGGYEASNALFRSPDGGAMLLAATKGIIRRSDDD